MGFSIFSTGARGRHTAGYGSAGCIRISPFSSHIPEYLVWFTSDPIAGMLQCLLLDCLSNAVRRLPICRQGLERLVATKSVVGKVAEQIVKVAIDRLKQPSPLLALPALQLLLTCMYTEAADRLNQPGAEEPLPDVEPEALVRSIERTSAIFDKIRKGHPMEVEVLCTVLSGVLGDFFPPSEILTKVIGEFLSPQQPHPRLLSAVVFKVCI